MKRKLHISRRIALVITFIVFLVAGATILSSVVKSQRKTLVDNVPPTVAKLPVAGVPTFTASATWPPADTPLPTKTSSPIDAPPSQITTVTPYATSKATEPSTPINTLTPVPSSTNTVVPPTIAAPTVEPIVSVDVPQQPVTDQVVIRFVPGTTEQQRADYIKSLGGTVEQQINALDTVVITVPEDMAEKPLPISPAVAAVEQDYYVVALDDTPSEPYNDPLFTQQWALPVIGAPDAWVVLPPDAPTITVAVIDSGVCADHPDLAGRVQAGWDFLEQDAVPQDDFGHGCSVAGVIAANPNNGAGIIGVAPNAQIMPLRVLNAQGLGSYSDVAAAIVYAVDNGAQIINLSLGGSMSSSTLESAVNYAAAHNVMVIAAAGNTGQQGVLYPAAYSSVIAVGSVDSNLQRSSFSSYGPEIDLLAPGRDILTTKRNGSYGLASGTSFAAPHVAGVAVLELSNGTALGTGDIVRVKITPTPSITEAPAEPTYTSTAISTELAPSSDTVAIKFEPFIQDKKLKESIFHTLVVQSPGLFQGSNFVITSMRQEGNWALISIVSIDKQDEPYEHIGTGDSASLLLVHEEASNTWNVGLRGTQSFSSLLKEVPETFLSAEAKSFLDPFIPLMNATTTVEYKFPWSPREWEYWDGWHEGNSLDIGTRGNTVDKRILAAANGYITYICIGKLSANVHIRHHDGQTLEYYHLDRSRLTSEVELGKEILKGQVIGTLRSGSWAYEVDGCGRASQGTTSAHIHWRIPSLSSGQSFTADGWTINYGDSTWRKDTQTRSPNKSPYEMLSSTNYIVIKQIKPFETRLYWPGGWPYLFRASDNQVQRIQVDSLGPIDLESGCEEIWLNILPGSHLVTYWYEMRNSGAPTIEVNAWPTVPGVCAAEPSDPPSTETPPPPPPPPPGGGDYEVTNISYPTSVNPGQSFTPEVRICVNRGDMRESRGDMLRNTDGNLFGTFQHVAVTGTVSTGQCFTFRFYDPITAPTSSGTYNTRWQLWIIDKYIAGTEVNIQFTVTSGSDGGSGSQVVTLHDDPGYHGEKRNYGVGEHDISSTWNDRAHSVTIPGGMSVKLFEHDHYNGQSMCFTTSTSSLPGPYAEGVSSLIVYNNNGCQGGGGEEPPNTCGGVILFDGGGNQIELTSSAANLAELGWNDRPRMLQVMGPYRATAYDSENFQGGSHGPFGSGSLVSIGTNVTSVRVEKTGNCPTPGEEYPPSCSVSNPGVYLVDGSGNELRLLASNTNLSAAGWNDRAREMYVRGPYKATAYDSENFQGGSGHGPLYDGQRQGIGTNVTSVKVEFAVDCTVPLPPPPKPDLIPYPRDGASEPVVASIRSGNQSQGTLITGQPVYFDVGFKNIDAGNAGAHHVKLWIDGQLFIDHSVSSLNASQTGGFDDWMSDDWTTPGCFTVTLAVDSNSQIEESNEGNNTWTGQLCWKSPSVQAVDVYTEFDEGAATALGEPQSQTGDVQPEAQTTDFNAGDPIRLFITAVNDFPTEQVATFEWKVLDPLGRQVGALSWYGQLTTGSGTWFWSLSTTIPPDSLTGDYTFIGSITFNGQKTIEDMVFHVNGVSTIQVLDVFATDSAGVASSLTELPQQEMNSSSEINSQAVQTSFSAGAEIQLYMDIYNNVAADEPAYFEWIVIDPWGRIVPELQWIGDLNSQFGRSSWWLTRTIPDHAITGDYTFSGTITYSGHTTYDVSTFHVTGPSGPVNDGFGAAKDVSSVPFVDIQNTWGAQTASDDPVPSCAPNVLRTVWYRYTADSNTINLFTNASNYDTVVSVWTGTRGQLSEVSCDDDSGPGQSSFIHLNTVPGTTYRVMVGGYNGASGVLQFEASKNICHAVTEIPGSECYALVSFYNATNGDAWNNNTGWLQTATPCSWHGVTCNEGHVTELYLADNHLVGTIPPQVQGLTNLEYLYLYYNQLSGSIPPELTTLSNLKTLDVGYNQLIGSIPYQMENLSSLRFLYLDHNSFTGNIPPTFANLSNLTWLVLGSNQLTGSIPSQLGNLIQLEGLFLYDNQLTGSIPAELGDLSNLIWLNLGSNQLTGTVPAQFGNLSGLATTALQSTKPADVDRYKFGYDVEERRLSSGMATAENTQTQGLTGLRGLWLYSNQFSGSIPAELGNLTNLEYFGLDNNQLSGPIPYQLGNLTNLLELWVANNRLYGSIPGELGNLTQLDTLRLENNALEGELPTSLTNLTNLLSTEYASVDIGYNKLLSSNPTVAAFFDTKAPDWAQTQTVAPLEVQVEPISLSKVRVSWIPIAYRGDGGHYEVKFAQTPGGPYLEGCTTADKTATHCDVDQLTSDTDYYFVVRTYTPAHWDQQNELWSSYSSEMSATIPSDFLFAPTDLTAVVRSTTQIDLTWSDNSADEDSFHIERSLDGVSGWEEINVTQANVTSYQDSGLTCGTTYYYRVQAYSNHYSDYSELASAKTNLCTPVLRAPANGSSTRDTTPTFKWRAISGVIRYQIQVDNNSNFATPLFTVNRTTTSYTRTSTLADGRYFWRVRTQDAAGDWSAWSTRWSFTVDTRPPSRPVLVSPINGAATPDSTPLLRWRAATGATKYTIQLDNDPNFSSPITNKVVMTTSYTQSRVLAKGLYYWRVRAQDAAGNISAWSVSWSFTVSTGAIVPATDTPVPTITTTLTPTPTDMLAPSEALETPTPTPTEVVDDTLQRIESDQPAVLQTGVWTSHSTDVASGGSYLYSSGGFDDVLGLTFVGSQVEVIYIKHPALGTFAVEIDGAVMQLVDSTAAESEFGAGAVVSDLADGPHTLRVYPVAGVVALDAFGVEALPDITATPTPTPTGPPTLDVTPTDVPPDQSTLIPTPTSTPLLLQLPVIETFDSALNWLPTGAWVFDTQTAYRGAGWFATSTTRGQSSTLTFNQQMDLQTALNPELIFWQKTALVNADFFAIDVSLDGGLNWLALDQQAGQVTDWTQRTLDLTAYRGQVILLRFRLDTLNSLPEDAVTMGVWIDELVIQEALPTPTPTVNSTDAATATDLPTSTPIPPTVTDLPTVTPIPTETPLATATSTEVPTELLLPTEVSTETPVFTEPPAEVPAGDATEEISS